MNQIVAPLRSKLMVPATRALYKRADQAFLPAALEIIETPPSPAGAALLLSICLMASLALAWSWFGHMDIFAVATGKIRPIGESKTVESVETGRVLDLPVSDGAHVKKGDVLLTLDITEPFADALSTTASLAGYRAEILRRHAAIEAVGKDGEPGPLAWPSDIPPDIRDREERVLRHDLSSLNASLRSLDAQAGEKTAQRERLLATTNAEQELIRTLQDRVDMRNTLMSSKSGTKANVIDALQSLQAEQATLAADKGWLAEAEAALNTIRAEQAKTRETFTSDNAQKLAEAERQGADFAQRLVKARAQIEHRTLRSPIDGTVQSLAVTTSGQVVSTGQQLMRVVPDNAPLEVEAYVENRDIAFVREGQDAVVKVEALPFTRYGTVSGKIARIAHDSIVAVDAQRSEGDPTQLAKVQPSEPGNGHATQNLVYPVTIRLDQTIVAADGRPVSLSPGMTVSAEVRTGSRRILEYLFSPLMEVGSEAMGER